MDDLISVTCHLAQNFTSQGWVTKEGDVLGVMAVWTCSPSVPSPGSWQARRRAISTTPPEHRGQTHRASATQGVVKLDRAMAGVVKPDRATANCAPGAPGKDEALWELVYFFDNMDNPAGTPRKQTGDPHFTRQHLVATFMDLILFVHGMVAPRACLPSRGYEVLTPSLTVPRPAQFFQGIAEQGYVWQNVPYGINFTGDISVYGRSGTFWSWGKAQLGLVCVCAGEPRPAYMTRPPRAGHPAPTQEFPVFSRCFGQPGFPLALALQWTRAFGPRTAAGKAHASPRSAVGVSVPQPTLTPSCPPHTPLHAGRSPVPSRPFVGTSTPWRRDRTAPSPAPTGPSSAGRPARNAVPLWLPVGWPNVRIPDVPDPLLSSPAPTPRLRPTRGRTYVVELPPPRHARSPLLAHSASGGPPGEDAQAVCSTCRMLRGLIPGGTRVRGMPVPPQGFLGVVAHLRSLADQTSLAPWDFDPQGDGVLPWLLPWACVLISWVHEDMHVAPGSDHRGAIVNMYLELSRMEWWALSDRREVLSEWCKGASMPV
ncbi:hypothetical protein K439DRAFT_1614537 [Ramaria rubella]|nr:hypothetical protein K439DRAFT_1614537 [Ramaria rubella]